MTSDEQLKHDIINSIDTAFSFSQLSNEQVRLLNHIKNQVKKQPVLQQQLEAYFFEQQYFATDLAISRIFYLTDLFDSGYMLNQLDPFIEKIYTLNQFNEIFWNIIRRRFLSPKIENEYNAEILMRTFNKLSLHLNKVIDEQFCFNYAGDGSVKNIAILSPMMLDMRHSPTREAISLALHLEKYHNCNVYIFNINAMVHSKSFAIIDNFISRGLTRKLGLTEFEVNYLDFHHAKVKMVNFASSCMSTNKIFEVLLTLNNLNIDAVISHSENLFIQDVIYGKLPSIFATTGSALPLARSDAYWVPRHSFDQKTQGLANKFARSNFMLESMLVTPEGIAEQAKDRQLFGITTDRFIYLVVSRRLPQELSPHFIAVCEQILAQAPTAIIAFCGVNDFEPQAHFNSQLIADNRVISLGFNEDLPAVCKMADVYLNPDRQGGGTSSQTAILNGLPIVTLNYGHISSVVPEDRVQANWDSYLDYAFALFASKPYLDSEAAYFAAHYARELQTKDQVARLYNKLVSIANTYYSSSPAN